MCRADPNMKNDYQDGPIALMPDVASPASASSLCSCAEPSNWHPRPSACTYRKQPIQIEARLFFLMTAEFLLVWAPSACTALIIDALLH